MSDFQKAAQQWTRVLGALETAHSSALEIKGVVAEDMADRIERLMDSVGVIAAGEMERLTGGKD